MLFSLYELSFGHLQREMDDGPVAAYNAFPSFLHLQCNLWRSHGSSFYSVHLSHHGRYGLAHHTAQRAEKSMTCFDWLIVVTHKKKGIWYIIWSRIVSTQAGIMLELGKDSCFTKHHAEGKTQAIDAHPTSHLGVRLLSHDWCGLGTDNRPCFMRNSPADCIPPNPRREKRPETKQCGHPSFSSAHLLQLLFAVNFKFCAFLIPRVFVE